MVERLALAGGILIATLCTSTSSGALEQLWDKTDACLEPDGSTVIGLSSYESYVHEKFGVSVRNGVIAALIGYPSFRKEWALLLYRRKNGSFFVRVTTFDRQVWSSMMSRMQERQAEGSAYLGNEERAAALADVVAATSSVERDLDAKTAHLFVELWKTLIGRARPITVPLATGIFDGTVYRFWYRGNRASSHEPKGGSALYRVVFAAAWLMQLVEKNSLDDEESLGFIRAEMRDAIKRAREEPCVRPYRPQ